MPYIKINNPPLKLLIDTGSTKSFINPEIASNYYRDNIFHEPFTVSTIFQSSSHEYCAEIPIFPEFNRQDNLKFYLFNFHNVYDGLIGCDNLKLLNARLDFVNSKLLTPNCNIPIHYQESCQKISFQKRIDPHTKIITKVPVNQNNGDIIIPGQIIQNCEIPETLTNSKNGFALVELLNKTDKEINLILTYPIRVTTFNANNYELFHADVSTTESTTPVHIENLIRTSHMNPEEREKILTLHKIL